ncbi:M23 family metallopeptidase [Phaeobacter sp. CAU 1743]|uniref:M23 family metallopeptidase n=1 Tax=Phaeobacter sp. CAU 1743 TaxID=3140367 RepID=UPI0023B538AB
MYRTLFALFSSLAAPVAAGDFALDWPIDCVLGDSCHIQQYVDRDPGPGAQDFTCNGLTYDGHKGTDIALPYLSDMQTGVTVRAAADGVVAGLRDGMPDQYATKANAAEIKDRECGNGLVLRHAGGWETQYCHMKRGSLRVAKGDRVPAGTALGEVGLSGKTQFPHLHLSLRKDGAVVDPFQPDSSAACGAASGASLWAQPVAYEAGGFLGAGFSTGVPAYDAIKSGATAAKGEMLAKDAPAMVFWAYAFGGREGDTLTLTIDGPGGKMIDQKATLKKDQAQFFRAAGKRLRRAAWPAGLYTGIARLMRDGAEVDRIIQPIRID